MVSSIASLTKLYGNLNVQNSHFVSIIINTKHHLVSTCDSFNNHNESFTNTVTLMHKWIAKFKSLITISTDKNILFVSEDMHIADQMLDDDHNSLDMNKYLYIYQHKDISGIKMFTCPTRWYQLGSIFYLAIARSQS